MKPIADHARHILGSGARMLTFGGDHYITHPLLKAHAEKFGEPLSLIHFDAHSDTWPDDLASSLNHGSIFYKAMKDGLIPNILCRSAFAPGTMISWVSTSWMQLGCIGTARIQ